MPPPSRRDGALLDALLDAGADLDDAVHVDAGQVHGVGVEHSGLDELLDLHDADAPGHRGERVEVARRLVEHEVAVAVPPPRVHEREVGDDRLLEHVVAGPTRDVEGAHVLGGRRDGDASGAVVAAGKPALRDLRADARLRVERGDARSAGAQLLGEGSLRGELELELAREELPLELLVLPHVRRRHLADAAGVQQHAETPVVDAAVVRDDREVARALREQGVDEGHRVAGEAEASDRQAGAVGDVGDGLGRRRDFFVDHGSLLRRADRGWSSVSPPRVSPGCGILPIRCLRCGRIGA